MPVIPTYNPQTEFALALEKKLRENEVAPILMPMESIKRDLAYWAYNFAYNQVTPDCTPQEQALSQSQSQVLTLTAKVGSLTTGLQAALPALQFYGQNSLYSALTSLLSPVLFGDKGAQARTATVSVQAALS